MERGGRITLPEAVGTVAVLSALFAFYLWTAFSGSSPVVSRKDPEGYYNLLTQSFLAGRLSLLIEPKRELLELPDPYDPTQNIRYRFLDASLYKGRYYLYFGPVPALLLFVPFRAFTDFYLTENLAALVFCFGGLVSCAALLLLARRRWFPDTPRWAVFAALFTLGSSNLAPFLLHRPLIYEVSVCCASFLATASLFFFASGGLLDRISHTRLLAGSLLLGLAVGSRAPLIFALVVPCLLALRFRRDPGLLAKMACLFGPFTLCLALLGLYNYLRFDSWTEFGLRFQLTAAHYLRTYRLFDPTRGPLGFYYFFLEPVDFSVEFPFWRRSANIRWSLPPNYYFVPITGVLAGIPFLNILFLLPLFYKRLQKFSPQATFVIKSCLAAGVTVAGFLCCTFPPRLRYAADFADFLLVAALLFWFYLLGLLGAGGWRRWATNSVCAVLLADGVLFNAAISLEGPRPASYRAIREWVSPLEKALAAFSRRDYGPLHLKVIFNLGGPGRSEPLVVTGTSGAADLVFVRYQEPDVAVFGLEHLGSPPSLSKPMQIVSGRVYDVEVHMGSLYPGSIALCSLLYPDVSCAELRTRLLVKVEGVEVLHHHGEAYPSRPSDVTIGRNRISGTSCGPSFSGRIFEARRMLPPGKGVAH